MSYGIYLFHWTVSSWLSTQTFVTGTGLYTPTVLGVAFVFVVILASLSWYLIERPLMMRFKSVKAIASPTGPKVEAPATALAEPAP